MYKSIKIAFQRILKFKAYSAINMGGLAIAISVCLAILLFTFHHFSYDKYVSNGENSYRLISRYGDGSYSSHTFAGFDGLLSDLPEIESHTRSFDNNNINEVFIEDRKINIGSAIFVDQSFLDFFSVKMISGHIKSINEPNIIMVTPRLAESLFPNKDAIGQTVLLRSFTSNQDSLIAYSIGGIIEPLPEASHIQYDMLLSQSGHFISTVETLDLRKLFGGLIYVKLYPAVDVVNLEKKLSLLIESKLVDKPGPPMDAFNHKLQQLYDIHFSQGLNSESQPTIRRSSLTILLLVGFLILSLASINFVIMYVARASFHQKSMLIVRFFGGRKMHLFSQTAIEVFISVCISFFMAFVLLTFFQSDSIKPWLPDLNISLNGHIFWIASLSLFIAINIIVSLLSSVNLLKRGSILQQTTPFKRFNVAIILVISQFALVIALIGFTMVINLQMNYIENKDLGYSSDNVMIVRVPQSNDKINILKDELASIPAITSTGTAHHYPGYLLQDMNLSIGQSSFPFKFGFLDQQALKTLKIEMLKYYSVAQDQASEGWIINQTFYNKLKSQYTEDQISTSDFPIPEDQQDDSSGTDFIILGVMNDFHYASLHTEIENFAFYIHDPNSRFNRFMLARFNQRKSKEVITEVENTISEIYPGEAFEYSFLDQEIRKQYSSEKTLLVLINAFSILAILVACFGLIGLTIFIIERRTKEIGIRKVNGSSVLEIMRLLNMDFLKWVAMAFIIATPGAFFAAQKWQQNFAYKITNTWWVFAIAGIITFVIVLLTVSWQTYKAARKNPIEALRYE